MQGWAREEKIIIVNACMVVEAMGFKVAVVRLPKLEEIP